MKKIFAFTFIILLNLCYLSKLHSQQFKFFNFNDFKYENQNYDSISSILNKNYSNAIAHKDTLQTIKTLLTLSRFNRMNLKYGDAFNTVGKALFFAEEYKDTLLMAESFEEYGVLNYLYKQDNEAGIGFKKAHQHYKNLTLKNKMNQANLYQSYYNLAMYYQRTNDAILEKYIDSLNLLSQHIDKEYLSKIYLLEKKSSIIERQGKVQQSLDLLLEAESSFETKNKLLKLSDIKKSYLIILYGRIGNVYMKLHKLDLAKVYFEKSISIKDASGENIFYKSYIYSLYSALLSQQGNYKLAYENQTKSTEINNTYLNPRNDENQGFLTIKNYYQDQLIKKNRLINSKNRELADKTENLLRFRIFFVIVLFVVIIIGLIIRSRIRFLKHQKLEQNSKELLDVKNKELTTNTLQLIEKEQVIKQLSDFIKEVNPGNKSKIILKTIERSSTSLWDSFNRRFNELNKGFYERLQEKVPDLSRSDRKLCALIKLNFSGKEMAYLLGISLGSVHVARHRLRKKMKLERHQNLTSFITSI
ncbi:helix-turn-helix transcriptional regulator [Polaribacter sp.]|uniref:helix-turn-helix transcriptional regulator n=1 Tax=Polaribacter sp. TaxID=1920175 RepID=UPI003EF67C56